MMSAHEVASDLLAESDPDDGFLVYCNDWLSDHLTCATPEADPSNSNASASVDNEGAQAMDVEPAPPRADEEQE